MTHTCTRNEIDLDGESVICASPDRRFEVRVPAYPEGCCHIRIVYYDEGVVWECVYWNQDEIQEDEDACAFGAAMGAVKQVFEGTFPVPTKVSA